MTSYLKGSACALVISLSSLLGLIGCGENTNPNGMFLTTDAKSESLADLFSEAERQYDLGNYGKALNLAQKALDKSPGNEAVSILIGYIHMSMAGIDAFKLVTDLIDQSATESASTATGQSASTDSCSDSDGAVKSLCKLGKVIGLTNNDKVLLTNSAASLNLDDDSADADTSGERIPKKASEARTAGVVLVTGVNQTIKDICPLVSESVKILISGDQSRTNDDPRHVLSACTPSKLPLNLKAKAHYLWAFAHLTEAIAYYTVFSEQLTNAQKQIDSLNSSDPISFIKNLSTVSKLVDAILPTDASISADTMLTAIFNDLEAAANGFKEIPGMPENITSSITKALTELKEKIKTLSSKANGGSTSTNTDNTAAVLKDQFTAQVSTEVQNKLKNSDGSLNSLGQQIAQDAEKKAALCTAYSQITTGQIDGLCN